MKTLVILMMSFFALSSQASSYSCKEIYDVRSEVLVTIKSTLGNTTTVEKKIKTTATSSDVSYQIKSKTNNVLIWMYLDEFDQSGESKFKLRSFI